MSMEWIRQSWLDTLALTADWMRSPEYREDMEMIITVNGLSDLAAARGFRIESVWMHGVITFDLIRVSDEVIVLEGVGTMDIERYFLEGRA